MAKWKQKKNIVFFFLLPGQGSLFGLSGPDPFLKVLQFVARLQLQAELAVVLGRAHDVPEEERHVEAARFCQVH